MLSNSFKKALTVAVILLFISVSVIPSTGTNVVEKSSNVSFDGNTLYVGGSGPGNYSTIQEAIDNASHGDTVFVYNGIYYENVVVDKSIDLIGEDKNSTVIDGSGFDDVIYVSADEVSTTGFTVQNSGYVAVAVHDLNGTLVDIFYDAGLEIRSNSNSVFGNIIAGYIFIKKSSDNSIFCNKISSIVLFNSSNNVISNNNVSDKFDGILLYYSSNNIISENDIYSTGNGLLLHNSSNYNKIYHNNFIENVQNAYDECNNSWDNGYPSCGNYWDNYSGPDYYWGSNQSMNGSDGIGDSPYNIAGDSSQDRYPLIEPYGMTKLTFSMGPGLGLFKFSGIIKNIGNKTAFNVQWKITIDGGFVVGRHSSGTLPKPLLPSEETSVTSKLIFGFGRITITVAAWADNAPLISESIPGTLFLIFLML